MHDQRPAATTKSSQNPSGSNTLPAVIAVTSGARPFGSGSRPVIAGRAGFTAQTLCGQATGYGAHQRQWQPGPAALLAAGHAYCANAKRLVRRLPAGAMRALYA